MATKLHYLTVQDILWINLQLTEKVHHFSFAKLEEATYYQYAYGESNSITFQAARFIVGFPKMHPLDGGNDATAFIGCLTFLRINGWSVELQDGQAADWYAAVQSHKTDASAAISSISKPCGGSHSASDVRTTIRDLIGDFPCALLALSKD